MIDVIAGAVAPGPYLLGDTFTAADVVIGSGVRWDLKMGTVPERPELAAYAARLEARPALRRATARDEALVAARYG